MNDEKRLKMAICKFIDGEKVRIEELVDLQIEKSILKSICFYLKWKATKDSQFLDIFISHFDKEQFDQNLQILERREHFIKYKRDINSFTVIEWEEEEDLKNLLEFFYKHALFDKRMLKRVEDLTEVEIPRTKMNITEVNSEINIESAKLEDYLKVKRRPMQTLDEYVEFITKTNNEIKNKKERKIQARREYYNLYQIDEEIIERNNDKSDEQTNIRGNLYKQG